MTGRATAGEVGDRGGRRLRWRAATLAALGTLILAVLVPALAARAESLTADLSSHLIAITTGFTGTEVVLFGAVDQPGDIAVIVEGPRGDVLVRRKGRVAGIWLNRESLRFRQVPGFYTVAVNRPLDQVVTASVLERHEIGLDHLNLEPAGKNAAGNAADVADFRAALIRNKQRLGLYGAQTGQVTFLGGRLFRTNVYFPANVPTGVYTVGVFLIRDGDVTSAQTTPLVVSKVGFSAEIYEFAQRQSLIYGFAAVIGAVAAGWLAGTIFRKA